MPDPWFTWDCHEPQKAGGGDWGGDETVAFEPLPAPPADGGELLQDAPPGIVERDVVPTDQLSRLPFKAVGQLRYFKAGERYSGSACVLAIDGIQDVILTAAHCVRDRKDQSIWHDRFYFAPAQHLDRGKVVCPHGWWTVERVYATGIGADLAICKTATPLQMPAKEPPRAVVGGLSIQPTPARNQDTCWLSIGYPNNLPGAENAQQRCWGSWLRDQSNSMLMNNLMGGGASGGPWVSAPGPTGSGPVTGINSGENPGETPPHMASPIFELDFVPDFGIIAQRISQPCPPHRA